MVGRRSRRWATTTPPVGWYLRRRRVSTWLRTSSACRARVARCHSSKVANADGGNRRWNCSKSKSWASARSLHVEVGPLRRSTEPGVVGQRRVGAHDHEADRTGHGAGDAGQVLGLAAHPTEREVHVGAVQARGMRPHPGAGDHRAGRVAARERASDRAIQHGAAPVRCLVREQLSGEPAPLRAVGRRGDASSGASWPHQIARLGWWPSSSTAALARCCAWRRTPRCSPRYRGRSCQMSSPARSASS